ncbi:hypothetical protein [Nostoc sp. 2RC]|uniref:hypothetical protein n=1 Tax=Nostoc sp. 2RC TaxID=2485484 RepID=UPI00162A239F|nr:hypothetical protein [Nostoc sp. 2RC]MBC1237577.1 hypothetical protein [Nostoc sp. 2RC]
MKKISSLVLLFLMLFSSKATAQILSKSGDYLYIENAPFGSSDQLSIEGIKKIKQFKTNSCGIALIKELNGESSPLDVLNLSTGQTQSFTIVGGMQDINKTPVCTNGILQISVDPGIFSVNDNVHETVYGFKLNPNTSYAFTYNSATYKKITPNSCGFAKIKKPDNIISDAALRIAYLAFSSASSFSTVIDDKTWENLPDKTPTLCLNNTKYAPYNP